MKETVKIEGMSCGGCVNGVQRALAKLGLAHADVHVGGAELEYDELKVTHRQIVDAIAEAGYMVAGTAPLAALR